MKRSQLLTFPEERIKEMQDPDFLIPDEVKLLSSIGEEIIDDYPIDAAKSLVKHDKAYVVSSDAIAFFEKEQDGEGGDNP